MVWYTYYRKQGGHKMIQELTKSIINLDKIRRKRVIQSNVRILDTEYEFEPNDTYVEASAVIMIGNTEVTVYLSGHSLSPHEVDLEVEEAFAFDKPINLRDSYKEVIQEGLSEA